MNEERSYVPFTEDMIATHTILVPTMLPMHFKMILAYMRTYGYKMELLETSGPHIAEMGLKYVHNDMCYPAILVIGQLMDAIHSGKYDVDKLALVQFQTGGGCRASNYIHLLRKALKKAGLGHIPVISISFQGVETHPGFKLDLKRFRGMMYGMLYGDLLMTLVNQTRPYELEKGAAQKLADEWTEILGAELGTGRVSYKDVKENYRRIIDSFARIPVEKRPAVKVGVVGEIFVKFSPLGNNNLEQFLTDEGAEVVVPGLMDFCLYSISDMVNDYKLYGRGYWKAQLGSLAFKYLNGKKQDMIDILNADGRFAAPTPFTHTQKLAQEYLSLGAKMGEGWLLTGEMIELIESGCKNIVCTQPFGCLPNHIVGKGMMKPIKERNPDVNIVAIDYDASSSKVNQENRLKLMLSNARANLEAELKAKEEKEYTTV